VCLWLWGVFHVNNTLLDLAFWSNLIICVFLIWELSPFTFSVMIERYLLISVFLLILFPPDWVSCCLFLTFGFVQLWFLLVYWVDDACYFPSCYRFGNSSFEFYSFLASYICDCSPCELLLSFSFVMQVWWTWTTLAYSCLGWSSFLKKFEGQLCKMKYSGFAVILTKLELYCSMLSWLSGLVLRSLR
jgi:hypothetical protein